MHITKLQFKNLVNKIVSSLTTHLSDPTVINYNFYDNTSGVGVKMVRKTNRMTVNDLAIKLNDLALIVYDLTLEVRAGFAKMDAFIVKQETFNTKQEEFNARQETFNAKQIAFNEEVIKRLDRIENCPTVKKEILKGQTRI